MMDWQTSEFVFFVIRRLSSASFYWIQYKEQTVMLFDIYKPSEISPETRLYAMFDERMRPVPYPRHVKEGRPFPPTPRNGYTYGLSL